MRVGGVHEFVFVPRDIYLEASTSLCVQSIAPSRLPQLCGLKAQAKSRKRCLPSMLVHAGIIALRDPALLNSKRSGHCV